MKFLLKCKHCGNQMLYETRSQFLTDKSKQCVYCGKSFAVKNAILKEVNP